MIKALLQRNVTGLFSKNLSSVGKSNGSLSLSVFYFSTSKESKFLKTPTVAPAVFEFLRYKHQFSPEVASHVASVLTGLKDPQKSDSVISFFKEIGFTQAHLERILKSRPSVLLASLDKIIKPKIKIFQDLGFSAKDIVDIISKQPGILLTSANNRLIPQLSLLKGFLGSNKQVAKALKNSGWLLITDLEKSLVPNIRLLESCGMSMVQITMLLNHLPRFLLYKPEIVRKCVDKVHEMGVDRGSKMYIYAVGVVGSLLNGTWELKLQAFRNILEFSEDDILRVFRQSPQVFSVSEDKIKKVKEVLLATGKYKTSCIVKYPQSLMYSIDKRYKTRFKLLGILESRHLIKEWPCLGTICTMPEDRFFKNFVSPYLNEVGDVYPAQRALNNEREVKLM